MSVQAIGMTLTLGLFGDVTRVNIVYSLRGLWGVLWTWLLARQVDATGSGPSCRTMVMRLIGAVLIGAVLIGAVLIGAVLIGAVLIGVSVVISVT
ncbi:MAG: pentapeptide repeat-containing protein [Planctomycetota bacterium]|nr:pentapeptide repeat-containing protein [Planctomycetota bacterium]